jgi:hypothetical protein
MKLDTNVHKLPDQRSLRKLCYLAQRKRAVSPSLSRRTRIAGSSWIAFATGSSPTCKCTTPEMDKLARRRLSHLSSATPETAAPLSIIEYFSQTTPEGLPWRSK